MKEKIKITFGEAKMLEDRFDERVDFLNRVEIEVLVNGSFVGYLKYSEYSHSHIKVEYACFEAVIYNHYKNSPKIEDGCETDTFYVKHSCFDEMLPFAKSHAKSYIKFLYDAYGMKKS